MIVVYSPVIYSILANSNAEILTPNKREANILREFGINEMKLIRDIFLLVRTMGGKCGTD